MYARLIAFASIAGIVLFVTNALAVTFYWYVSMPWFDMLMHNIGGVFVGLTAGAIFLKQIKNLKNKEILITILLFVFIVGLAWEYYEYIVQIYIKSVHLADLPDSISDLMCDMTGGIIGTYFVILTKRRYNNKNVTKTLD